MHEFKLCGRIPVLAVAFVSYALAFPSHVCAFMICEGAFQEGAQEFLRPITTVAVQKINLL